MKYFLDTEFIESFHKPLFGKRRHFIDLISIGIVSEDNRAFYLISSEYDYNDADQWVKENVIIPMYKKVVNGDNRNRYSADTFHKTYGEPINYICQRLLDWIGNDKDVRFYGYYCDYDWVLLCSMFGRMIDLPKGWPMYCRDLKQRFDEEFTDEIKNHKDYPVQKDEHNALLDAAWTKSLHGFMEKYLDEKI
jgi:hypothetical protein